MEDFNKQKRREKIKHEKDVLKESAHRTRESAHRAKEDVKVNIKQAKKAKVVLSLLKLALLVLIVIAVPLYMWFFQRDTITQFNSMKDIVQFLETYKTQSIFVYIGIQVAQIVISVLPGQGFQFAAGYLYGAIPALIYSWIGATIGTLLSFYLAKILGRDALHLLFGEERMNYFIERLNNKRAYTIVFLIYLIPGLPKDMVSYAAGASEIKFKAFLILSLIGRTPGMAGSILIGAFYHKGDYVPMIIIGILAIIAFIFCIIYRKKISNLIERFYEKIV